MLHPSLSLESREIRTLVLASLSFNKTCNVYSLDQNVASRSSQNYPLNNEEG